MTGEDLEDFIINKIKKIRKGIVVLKEERKIIIPYFGIVQRSSGGYILYRNGNIIHLTGRELIRLICTTNRRKKSYYVSRGDNYKRLLKHRALKILHTIIKHNNLSTNIIDKDKIIKITINLYPKIKQHKVFLVDVVVFLVWNEINRVIPLSPIKYLRNIKKLGWKITVSKFMKLKALLNKYSNKRMLEIMQNVQKILLSLKQIPYETRRKIYNNIRALLLKITDILPISPKMAAVLLTYYFTRKLNIKVSSGKLEKITGISKFTILRKFNKLKKYNYV